MTETKSNATKKGLSALVAVAALLVALALPLQASAQSSDPTAAQYAPPTCTSFGGGSSQSGSIACQDIVSGGGGGGSLPFTGMDIVPLAAIAIALAGAGLVIRRVGTGGSEKL